MITFASNLLLFLVVVFFRRYKMKEFFKDQLIPISTDSLKLFAEGIFVMILLCVPAYYWSFHLNLISPFFENLLVFTSVALFEEFFFRSFLNNIFNKYMRGATPTFLIAVLFALFHFPHYGLNISSMMLFLNAFVVSLSFSISIISTKSIFFAVAAHAAWNAVFASTLGLSTRPELKFLLLLIFFFYVKWRFAPQESLQKSLSSS